MPTTRGRPVAPRLPLTPERRAERDRLVSENGGLVYRYVFAYLRRTSPVAGYDQDDLEQAGFLGLLYAAERFDPARNLRFSTWAVSCISGFVKRYANEHRAPLHVPAHAYGKGLYGRPHKTERGRKGQADMARCRDAALACARLGFDPPADTPDRVADTDEWLHLRRLLWGLTRRQRAVLRLRFGFDGPPLLLSEVGERLGGVTKERIRQIEEEALERLREALGCGS